MSQELRESISSVVDGEADSSELRHALDALTDGASDASELTGVWLRYHAYSAVLRGEETSRVPVIRDWEKRVAEFDGDINDGVPQPRILPFRSSYKNVVRNRWLVGATTALAASLAVVLSYVAYFGVFDSASMPEGQLQALETEVPEATRLVDQLPRVEEPTFGDVVPPIRDAIAITPSSVAENSDLAADLQTVRYQQNQQDVEAFLQYLRQRGIHQGPANGGRQNALQPVSSPSAK